MSYSPAQSNLHADSLNPAPPRYHCNKLYDDNDNDGFVSWLANQGKAERVIREYVSYARRYSSVLDTQDASIILAVNPQSRHHILSALANYSKYTGRYDQWQQIVKRYNLKWQQKADPMKHFQKLLNPELSLETMLQAVRLMMQKTPVPIPQIVKWGVLVGLRSSEIIESVRLINNKEAFSKYYDPEQMTLNHWKMPGMLRTTKKAYQSFVTPEMLSIVQKLDKIPSKNAITCTCYRKGITMNLFLTRKIHATYLYEHGIPIEIINALQGRTPANIFARHYYRPSLDYKSKVLDALEQLHKKLAS